MKIIFAEAVQSYGGAQIATLDLATRLRDIGCEVVMVDNYGSCKPYVEAVKRARLVLEILQNQDQPYVIKKYNSRWRNSFRILCYIPHWIKMRAAMNRVLDRLAPDVVVTYNTKSLSLVKKSDAYRTVYYAHGWYLPQQNGPVMRWLLTTKADILLAVSQATRMALYADGIAPLEKIMVVHNAIDQEVLSKEVAEIPNSEGRFKVLVCGGFLPDKGLHIAVEVARVLRDRNFPIKLIITGIVYKNQQSEQYHRQIEKMIEAYELGDVVELVVGKPNVIDYFRACDCLIHPSATEGLPLVVLEAMALKKPVVANAVGGVTDMVVDGFTGVISPQNDVAFYASAIERLCSDADYRNRMAVRAKELIDTTFTKQVQVTQFIDAINRK